KLSTLLGSDIPVIGAGGVMRGADAADKLAAGATLVQLYSGLIYRGPELVTEAIRATQ
ncbi:MAG TPA: quinone-dependent dihydroorotate dehydrogenase, partial [Burkholderiales bacterium]